MFQPRSRFRYPFHPLPAFPLPETCRATKHALCTIATAHTGQSHPATDAVPSLMVDPGRNRALTPCIHLWALAPLPARATPRRGASPPPVSASRHRALRAPRRHSGHLEPFPREVSDRSDGHGLPSFVEYEFRNFLRCGILAEGFTRLRCPDCAFERVTTWSRRVSPTRSSTSRSAGRGSCSRAAASTDSVSAT